MKENNNGVFELTDEELAKVVGGGTPYELPANNKTCRCDIL